MFFSFAKIGSSMDLSTSEDEYLAFKFSSIVSVILLQSTLRCCCELTDSFLDILVWIVHRYPIFPLTFSNNTPRCPVKCCA